MFRYSDTFPFLRPLEQNWETIKQEYLAVSTKTSEWPETYLHNGKWDTFGIYFGGNRLEGEKLCPLTSELVHKVPGLFIAGFSILRPGCVITPHVGYTDTVWRSHLGLICPKGAWIEVGGVRHGWQEGEAVVFDDTILHNAANEADTDRVVLIVDFIKEH
jgi:ornithine lipid ester-linked acyl 2-hydroxylase